MVVLGGGVHARGRERLFTRFTLHKGLPSIFHFTERVPGRRGRGGAEYEALHSVLQGYLTHKKHPPPRTLQ